jgi:hypothetical protein
MYHSVYCVTNKSCGGFVFMGLQGVSALGLCLIFGGYLEHVRKLSDEVSS